MNSIGPSTHLTQGAENAMQKACMFAANIFHRQSCTGFKRRSERSHLSPGFSCPERFANGWIGGLQAAGCRT